MNGGYNRGGYQARWVRWAWAARPWAWEFPFGGFNTFNRGGTMWHAGRYADGTEVAAGMGATGMMGQMGSMGMGGMPMGGMGMPGGGMMGMGGESSLLAALSAMTIQADSNSSHTSTRASSRTRIRRREERTGATLTGTSVLGRASREKNRPDGTVFGDIIFA